MITTIDFIYVVIARFQGRLEVWRDGPFDSSNDAMEAWEQYAKEPWRAGEVEFVKVTRLNLTADGSLELMDVPTEADED